MAEVDYAKFWHWLGAPLRLWKSSLTLRVVTSSMLGSLLVLLGSGVFLLYQVTEGIATNAREAAISEARQAMLVIEAQMRAAGYGYANSDALYSIITAAIDRGTSSGYQVKFFTDVGTFSSPSTPPFSATIPDSIMTAVVEDPLRIHSVPIEALFHDGVTGPGLIVASTVSGGGLESFQVFFTFSFEQEANTLTIVQTAVGLSGLVLLIGIGLVAYVVSRQTLRPLQIARRAAERLASGELTQLMKVRGTDDLAQLAVAMNRMAKQLQQRIRQLEQLSQVQQRFVSDVSHELRTPLTTVRLAADVLYDNRGSLPKVEQVSIELLHKEVNRFEALLGDLLEISRFDAGVVVLDLDEVNLVDLVKAEIEALDDLAKAAGSEMTVVYEGDCLAQVDSRRISRLIRNLLSNAIEHGEGRPIDVYLVQDDAVVAFAVRDHGVGFTPEQGRQLFNRFWRADPARARHIGGTGLGLAISQEDVRLHQGWIHAWGRLGQGAQFRVVLPRETDVVLTYSPIPLIPLDAEPDGGKP